MFKRIKNSLIFLWYFSSGVIVTLTTLFIIIYIFKKGLSVITLEFLLDTPKGMPLGVKGGIFPAIIGSLFLISIACISASILGISTALYLSFYCVSKKTLNFYHLVISSMSGVPSILLGLFGYSFLVYFCKFGISLLSGGITLGIMIFPYIEVVCEKCFQEVDKDLIISSYSLGVNKFYTIIKIVLPLCHGEIFASIILSGGFALGAAAPIMLTSAVISAPIPDSFLSPVMALPYHLYMLVSQGISFDRAYGTATIILILLLFLNLTAPLLRQKRR